MKRLSSVSILITIVALLSAPLAAEDKSASKPNVILVMCDDLGWGDTGFQGNKIIRTPHLDEMAKSGIRFTRFYAAAPVCSPTRGSCLTGRHPFRYGIFGANPGHMLPRELTLAELLKKHGYRTGHFGKWHLGTLTKTVKDSNRGGPQGAKHFSPPSANGFDVNFSTEAKVPTYDPLLRPAPQKAGKNGKKRRSNNTAWDAIEDKSKAIPYGTRYWNEKGEEVTENCEGDNSRVIMDRAIPFIEASAKASRPFFAVVWFHAPHLPVVAGPKHVKPYAEYSVYERNYFGCITALDEQVGRLRAKLRELGVAKDTMLWFCSDNGPEGKKGRAPGSAGPFRGRKRSLYEGGIRVPALLEWPTRVSKSRVVDFPCVTSDYLPTIAAAIGVAVDEKKPLDGISLLPVIDGKLETRPSGIGFQSRMQLALTEQRFKLYSSNRGASWELYDLLADPSESTNLASKSPQRVQGMAAKLHEWRRSCETSRQAK